MTAKKSGQQAIAQSEFASSIPMLTYPIPHNIWYRPCADAALRATVDRLHESIYFYSQMLDAYHSPDEFRYNLNAFLQALRSTAHVMEKESKKSACLRAWHKKAEQRIESDPLLSAMRSVRNFVVHKGMLQGKSRAAIGIFRWHKCKLAFQIDPNPFADSRVLLMGAVKFMVVPKGQMGFLHSEHDDVGEEIGVERIWVVDRPGNRLGDRDITDYCRDAFDTLNCFVQQAVSITGGALMTHRLPPSADVRILTETDVDPSLIQKWGWDKA